MNVLLLGKRLLFFYNRCNHLFFADDVKLIAPISKQHELGSSIRQAFNWSQRWDLPLNASKSHHLSIGGTPDLRIALPQEAAGKSLHQTASSNRENPRKTCVQGC